LRRQIELDEELGSMWSMATPSTSGGRSSVASGAQRLVNHIEALTDEAAGLRTGNAELRRQIRDATKLSGVAADVRR
jgi:hypothetical protein